MNNINCPHINILNKESDIYSLFMSLPNLFPVELHMAALVNNFNPFEHMALRIYSPINQLNMYNIIVCVFSLFASSYRTVLYNRRNGGSLCPDYPQ